MSQDVSPASDEGSPVVTLDEDTSAAIEALGTWPYLDLEHMPIQEALLFAPARNAPMAPPPGADDMMIDGYRGEKIRVRVYRPPDASDASPALMHLHGGGFVTGSVEGDDARCAWLAREARSVVVSVDYRLAPEHPFPTAIEDASAAWRWLTAGSLADIDVSRCAISGSSAGGHIAVGVLLLARKRALRMPLIQILTYPVIDPSLSHQSYTDFASGPFLTRARMAWYWKQYAGSTTPGGELWDPLTTEPKGLPPAHVVTAEYDVLRDEAEAWAAKLATANIRVSMERHPMMIHGFVALLPHHAASIAALQGTAAALRKAFADL